MKHIQALAKRLRDTKKWTEDDEPMVDPNPEQLRQALRSGMRLTIVDAHYTEGRNVEMAMGPETYDNLTPFQNPRKPHAIIVLDDQGQWFPSRVNRNGYTRDTATRWLGNGGTGVRTRFHDLFTDHYSRALSGVWDRLPDPFCATAVTIPGYFSDDRSLTLVSLYSDSNHRATEYLPEFQWALDRQPPDVLVGIVDDDRMHENVTIRSVLRDRGYTHLVGEFGPNSAFEGVRGIDVFVHTSAGLRITKDGGNDDTVLRVTVAENVDAAPRTSTTQWRPLTMV